MFKAIQVVLLDNWGLRTRALSNSVVQWNHSAIYKKKTYASMESHVHFLKNITIV